MKRMTMIVLITWLIASCQNDSSKSIEYEIPNFKPNIDLTEVEEPIREIAQKKDFTIAYTIVPNDFGPSEHTFKMFCLKGSTWEKIEIRKGITEVDTVYSNSEGDIVEKQILLRLECRKYEGDIFFKKLISYNLFNLDDEDELEKKCLKMKADYKLPEYIDIGYISLYIIHGNYVRNLNYHTYMREKDCPGMSEWQNIKNIKSIFKDEWYAKEH